MHMYLSCLIVYRCYVCIEALNSETDAVNIFW